MPVRSHLDRNSGSRVRPGPRGALRGLVAAIALVTIAPLVPSLVVAQDGPDRSGPPATGPAPPLRLPVIEKHTLSNGLPVWIVEMHEVPIVDVTMIVKSGGGSDPDGLPGLAHYTAAMLDEGAGERDALELADAIDFLGASLGTSSSFDASLIRLRSLVTTLDEALPLMADVLLRPTFPETDMERLRAERQTSLLQIRDDVASLASTAYRRLLFGDDHRYGTPLMGTAASNRAMTAADLRGFHAAHYQPQNAHLLVVGDVSAVTLLPALEEAFGSWADGAPVHPMALPDVAMPDARDIYLVDKPGAEQSQIRVGTTGVSRSTPDYFVLDVMNTILGGSFASRLNQNLREEHGYTYDAGSSFVMRRTPGYFVAQAGVQTDKTAESLLEFFRELDGMAAPVPEDELTRARNLQALGFPGGFETASNMAGRLAELVIYDLPESFFDTYVPNIQAVTGADLERAARQYLPTDRFIVVVAGDLAAIEEPIRATGLGPVTVVAADDVLR